MRLSTFALTLLSCTSPAFADDPILNEVVEFTGQIFHLDTGVPGVVIAAVHNGNRAVFGFGETAKGNSQVPDADTVIGVGSITKSFTGLSLAHLVANGTVSLSDPVGPLVGIIETMPNWDGRPIELVNLATHSAGMVRELEPVEGVKRYSDDSFIANVNGGDLLFAPGTGILYSNVAFDLLAMALSGAAEQPYEALLKTQILDPLGLEATGYARPVGDKVMAGYDWNGNAMPADVADPNRRGASQLYTTANDMLRYLEWNLDRFGGPDQEARRISHAAWLIRDGVSPVYGMDESGDMDAMGLGWVIMMPEGDRPLIIQKAGGTNGVFSYLAFAPSRNIGIFMSFNQFDFSASSKMAEVVNQLIANLAPR